MIAPSVVIHERVANWSRQLRPRFQGWPVRWSETRSAAELALAAGRSSCSILVVALDQDPARGLRDFDQAFQVAPLALSILIDPSDRLEVAEAARELGATVVLSGVVNPPEVEFLLRQWVPLARSRSEAQGWAVDLESPRAGTSPADHDSWPTLLDSILEGAV